MRACSVSTRLRRSLDRAGYARSCRVHDLRRDSRRWWRPPRWGLALEGPDVDAPSVADALAALAGLRHDQDPPTAGGADAAVPR